MRAAWPREERPISRLLRIDLQRKLADLGYPKEVRMKENLRKPERPTQAKGRKTSGSLDVRTASLLWHRVVEFSVVEQQTTLRRNAGDVLITMMPADIAPGIDEGGGASTAFQGPKTEEPCALYVFALWPAISVTQPRPEEIVKRNPCSFAIALTKLRPRPSPGSRRLLSDR